MGCKVELRDYGSSWQDKEVAFKKMFATFKKLVADAGIVQRYRQHEFYESPGQKIRRKKKESKSQYLKQKLRENFPERE